jgi:formyltetrahydrofolate deformylase
VRNVLADVGAGVAGLQSYTDPDTGWTHSRSEIDLRHAPLPLDRLRGACAALAARADMRIRIADAGERKRVVVLASKSEHCLRELLARSGELPIDIACVISNHEDLRALAESHRLPFHHVPMSRADRDAAFERVIELYTAYRGELMVLARFMQIVPAAVCEKLAGRIINIHHSLLPAFIGARPYHQAWQRGVKWIGATAHYVTAELDQGPIIEQDTTRIDHAHSAEQLTRLGARIEARVLAAGVAAHAEDRVILSGVRTIVFERLP